MSYENGQKIRINFSATVDRQEGPNSTTRVIEKGTGLIHYLFLDAQEVRDQILAETTEVKPRPGETIQVDFTATVKRTEPYAGNPPDATTTVMDMSDFGFTHYVYTDSPSVTLDEPVQPEPQQGNGKYKAGAQIRVKFTAVVTGRETSTNGTVAVAETGGEGAGFTHYLFLGIRRSRDEVLSQPGQPEPAYGDTIEVDFTATVSRGGVRTPPLGSLGTVRSQGSAGGTSYEHYVYLGSPSVTEAEPEKPKPAFTKDQEIQVRFTGVVSRDNGPNATTKVNEIASGISHYLYLGPGVRYILSDGGSLTAPKPGDVISVDFKGIVKDNGSTFTKIPEGKTYVRSVPPEDSDSSKYTHYLDLSSPRITAYAESVPEKAARFKEGQKIRVRFAGVIGSEGGDLATRKVTETVNGKTYEHYLFQPGREELLAAGEDASRAAKPGDIFKFDFTATVVGNRDGLFTAPESVTVVRTDYNHLLDLSSPSVQEYAAEPAFPDSVPVAFTLPDGPGSKKISSTDDVISSREVIARVGILQRKREEAPVWSVTRDRTREVVGTFRTNGEALYYLTENDYNPARFTVRQDGLGGEDARELDTLTGLDSAGRAIFGYTRWTEDGVTLRPSRFYNDGFARELAAKRLGISTLSRLDEWPFEEFDWDSAAARELEQNYLVLFFAGAAYYAKVDDAAE